MKRNARQLCLSNARLARPVRLLLAWAALMISGLSYAGVTVVVPPPPVITPDPEPSTDKCTRDHPYGCLDGVGGGVTSLDQLRNLAKNYQRKPEESLREDDQSVSMRHTGAGGAAGEATLGNIGLFLSYDYTDFASDVRIGSYDGQTHNVMFGIDYTFDNRLTVGVFGGREKTSTDTQYNGGGQNRDGFLAGIYAAYLINDYLSANVGAGRSWLDTDEDRIDPAAGAETLFGKYDADRYFVTANLNYTRPWNDWLFNMRVGLLHATETQDAYTETRSANAVTRARSVRERDLSLTQLNIGIEASHSVGDFEPYALGGYRRDLDRDDGNDAGGLPAGIRTQPDDRDEFEVGFGLRYFGPHGISASAEYLSTIGREDYDQDVFSALLRMQF